ncbi:MAG: hypothetical protein CV089_08900 [Nitrospira sp. WS110]|nr:hypothetical protein [Nitrospira sp. WS110]
MNFLALGNSLSRIFEDEETTQTVLATKPAQKLLHQAFELLHGLSERDLERVIHYMQQSGKIDFHDLEDLEHVLEAGGFVKVGTIKNSPEEKPAQGKDTHWQERVSEKPLARMHKPQDKFSSMEVRFLPPVRKLVDRLAASKGMAAAECVESIVVDTINKNPDLIEQGENLLKEFGGNLTRVKRHAHEEKLARLEALEAKQSTVRR